MTERKINLAHINELHPTSIKALKENKWNWEVISSVRHENGNYSVLWNSPKGLWLEEKGRNSSDSGYEKKRLTLISPWHLEEVVNKIASKIVQ